MRLGIVANYRACDSGYAACQLANWGMACHCDVDVFSLTPTAKLEPQWDAQVKHNLKRRFTDWASGQDALVWTVCPLEDHLRWALRHVPRNIVLVLWHDLQAADRATLALATNVVAPYPVIASWLGQHWKQATTCIPWATWLPTTQKRLGVRARPKILIPCYDRAPEQLDEDLLTWLESEVPQQRECLLRFAYTGRLLAPWARRRLRRLAKEFPQHFEFCRGPEPACRSVYYQDYDLVLWPVSADNLGQVALEAMSVGTPVLAPACPPLVDLVRGGLMTVDCHWYACGEGQYQARPEWSKMGAALTELLKSPVKLLQARQLGAPYIIERQQYFSLGWRRLLGL